MSWHKFTDRLFFEFTEANIKLSQFHVSRLNFSAASTIISIFAFEKNVATVNLEFCAAVHRIYRRELRRGEGPYWCVHLRCDRLRLDVRISQLTNWMRTGESATVRDITEQYRSIRHHLHVDPAFQLLKQLRGLSAFRSCEGTDEPRRTRSARRLPWNLSSRSWGRWWTYAIAFRGHGTKNPTYDRPPTHLWGPNTAQREGSSPSLVFTIRAPLQLDQPGLLV